VPVKGAADDRDEGGMLSSDPAAIAAER